MKKLLAIFLAATMLFAFASCGETSSSSNDAKTYNVGIIQYMSHPSLDNCYKGIVEGLNASGVKCNIDYQTGSATSADSDCSNFAKQMVSNNVDIIFAIATPAAISAYQATDGTDIPVIFCAVSDPVAAELVKSNEKPGDNCTGTSDVLDLSAQVEMIRAFQPNVKKIGVLYTASEVNSVSNLKRLKEICDPLGIAVEASTVQNASDIPSAADTLASKVDCINNFTDNNVVNNLSVLLSAANKYNIPVYGSEEEQVVNGCMASVSIDYVALGKVTGEMGAKVLGGEKAAEMSVKTITDATPVVNKAVMESLKITLPQNYQNANFVTTPEKKDN